jgi:hypothetical protein
MQHNLHKGYLAAFLKNLTFFGAIVVPWSVEWLHIDFTRLFLLQAWFLFWAFTMEIPTGVVADKVGRKWSVAAGCILFGLDMLACGTVRCYWFLYIAEFLGAVGVTMISGAEQALFYDSLLALGKRDEARSFLGKYEAFASAGLWVSFPIGSWIGGLGNNPDRLGIPFWMTAASAALAAAAFLSMKEPPRDKSLESAVTMGLNGLKSLFAHRSLRAFVVNGVVIGSVTFFLFWFYQPVCQRAGIPVAYLGLVGAASNMLATLMLANVSWFEKVFGLRRLLLWTGIVPGLGFVAFAVVGSAWVLVPVVCISIAMKLLRTPVINDYINRFLESGSRATAISGVSLLQRSGTFVLYPIVGLLADRSLSWALLFLGAVCLTLAVLTRVSDEHCRAQEDSLRR